KDRIARLLAPALGAPLDKSATRMRAILDKYGDKTPGKLIKDLQAMGDVLDRLSKLADEPPPAAGKQIKTLLDKAARAVPIGAVRAEEVRRGDQGVHRLSEGGPQARRRAEHARHGAFHAVEVQGVGGRLRRLSETGSEEGQRALAARHLAVLCGQVRGGQEAV